MPRWHETDILIVKGIKKETLGKIDQIDKICEQTRKDIDSVDWKDVVPKILKDGMNFISNWIKEFCSQSTVVHKDLLDITGNLYDLRQKTGHSDEEEREMNEQQILLKNLHYRMKETIQLLSRLQVRIMTARDTFLDEQMRQIFAPLANKGR